MIELQVFLLHVWPGNIIAKRQRDQIFTGVSFTGVGVCAGLCTNVGLEGLFAFLAFLFAFLFALGLSLQHHCYFKRNFSLFFGQMFRLDIQLGHEAEYAFFFLG